MGLDQQESKMFSENCQKVLDEMDYARIAQVMNALDWKWEDYHDGLMDEYLVEEYAVSVMLDALEWRIDNFHIYQRGGFVVILNGEDVRMSFEIESADSVEIE
jgi:hypothetical protein